jgi:hypothetical protein
MLKFQCRFATEFPNTGPYCLAILSYGKSSLSPQSLKGIGRDSIVRSPCTRLHDFTEFVDLHVNVQTMARGVSTGPILGIPKRCILVLAPGPREYGANKHKSQTRDS